MTSYISSRIPIVIGLMINLNSSVLIDKFRYFPFSGFISLNLNTFNRRKSFNHIVFIRLIMKPVAIDFIMKMRVAGFTVYVYLLKLPAIWNFVSDLTKCLIINWKLFQNINKIISIYIKHLRKIQTSNFQCFITLSSKKTLIIKTLSFFN